MIKKLKTEIQKVIIGQEDLVDHLLIGLITGGHILVESVPGLAKTTAINTVSKALGIQFKRIQFTPDLLPSDLTGAQIYNPKTGEFSVKKGPIFTNLLLADEINRAPAKVQAALLEVMAERQVTTVISPINKWSTKSSCPIMTFCISVLSFFIIVRIPPLTFCKIVQG
jgi:MoxR-like ATPase